MPSSLWNSVMKGIIVNTKGVYEMDYLRRHVFGLSVITTLIVALLVAMIPTIQDIRHTNRHTVRAHHVENDADGFYTDIKINNISLGTAMIDTGSSDTSISIALASKAHLDWLKGYEQQYMTADNRIQICRVIKANLNAGGITKRVPISVCPKGDSLLGMTFISKTTMHLEKGVMTFR